MVNRVELNSWVSPDVRPKVAIFGAHPLLLGLLLVKLNSGKAEDRHRSKRGGKFGGK